MRNLFFTLILTVFILTSCSKEIDPFSFSKHQIGLLNDSTQVKDLNLVFANDSIVTADNENFTGNINDIQIFEKGGTQLLTLTPTKRLDSTATIKTIRIWDPRFINNKGLNSHSTFQDIRDHYTISSIDKTLRSLIVSTNEINAFFTISKDELPADMWFNTKDKVDPLQVPGDAKINAFFMQWTKN